jgi:hypothetical protein
VSCFDELSHATVQRIDTQRSDRHARGFRQVHHSTLGASCSSSGSRRHRHRFTGRTVFRSDVSFCCCRLERFAVVRVEFDLLATFLAIVDNNDIIRLFNVLKFEGIGHFAAFLARGARQKFNIRATITQYVRVLSTRMQATLSTNIARSTHAQHAHLTLRTNTISNEAKSAVVLSPNLRRTREHNVSHHTKTPLTRHTNSTVDI